MHLCRHLCEGGAVHHVHKEHHFYDSDYYYCFSKDYIEEANVRVSVLSRVEMCVS